MVQSLSGCNPSPEPDESHRVYVVFRHVGPDACCAGLYRASGTVYDLALEAKGIFKVTGRNATVERKTLETSISIQLSLDGTGKSHFDTKVPFLEHMLEQISRHGLFDLDIRCDGDVHIDDHHSVEDIGIALGEAFHKALGDRKGIVRYGHAYVPLDESLSRVVIDFSGRPGLHFNAEFKRPRVGSFDVDLTSEFFQGFANNARATLHLDVLRGENDHHKIETLFKAFGRALRVACSIDERAADSMPSTKGTL